MDTGIKQIPGLNSQGNNVTNVTGLGDDTY